MEVLASVLLTLLLAELFDVEYWSGTHWMLIVFVPIIVVAIVTSARRP